MKSAFYLSAASKSSGKTTLSIGLCAALSRLGYRVQPFKKGPDYIDPMWLGAASGTDCHSLDFYTQSHTEITTNFAYYSADADIALVEGNKGLYDGLALDGSNSNAAMAKLLGLPVVLVLDCRGTIRGIAPLLLGYQQFDQDVNIAGVILNRVGGVRHEKKLRAVVEHYTDIPVLGAMQNNNDIHLVERHLGLVPSNEDAARKKHIAAIADAVADQLDLETLLNRCAVDALKFAEKSNAPKVVQGEPVRIGYARDSAFGFYYPGDLQALRAGGAELIPFDTMSDDCLPAVDGLFIGGGFPETHLAALGQNRAMHASIRTAIDGGMPTYAECGGLMYLTRQISWRNETVKMVGVIPADTEVHDKPIGKGYIRLQETDNHPWPRTDDAQKEIFAHEFHYSTLTGLPEASNFAYGVERGYGLNGKHDGYRYKNLLACYAHLRHVEKTPWTTRFLAFVRDQKQTR